MPETKKNGFNSPTATFASSSTANAISALIWLTVAQFVTLQPEYIIVAMVATGTILTYILPDLGKKK